jgi:hypothetical protein
MDVRVEEESSVGEALDGGAPAGEEGAELVAVQHHRQCPGGGARQQHLVGGGHPNGEEVLDGGVEDPLAPEIQPGGGVVAFAGEGRAVAVPEHHPVPVVEI